MSGRMAATLPTGHRLGIASGAHRSGRKSPKSARKRHPSPKGHYDEKSVVLIQAALRRRHAIEEKSSLVRSRARRIRILQEIMATETDYVKNLAVLVESFLTSLVKSEEYADVLKPKLQQEFALVLPGVEMIRSYHVTLLAALNNIDTEDPYFEVGGIFLDVVMYFKSYSQYVSHYQVIVQILAQRKQDTELQQIFESLKPQALGKGLKDYMIMPVQRIPRYALLLHDMLRHTWHHHPDVAALSAAYNKVLDIAHNIENMSADAVSIEKVFELATCFLSNGEVFKLVVPHRRYIADAECLCSLPAKGVVMKTLQVFLFNDVIIWAKAKKDNKFNVVYTMPTLMLANVCLTDLWQETGGAEFIEMETLDSERLRMMVLEKNDEWFHFLELTKNNGKAWLPHHTSRDVSTTARYLTVGGEAAKAARQSPKVKETNKSKNKSMKLLGALRAKKSKVDVRDLGWMLSGKDKDKEQDRKGGSDATTSTRVVSLDLAKVSDGEKGKKLSSRPKSSRSSRDKMDARSSSAFKRTFSDRGTKDKMIFSADKHWSDEARGREPEREKHKAGKDKEGKERGKEKEKDSEREDRANEKEKEREKSEKEKERGKSKEYKGKDVHRRGKRRPSKQDGLELLPRRRGSSGNSHKIKDTSPKRSEGSEKRDRKARKGSGSITAEDEGDSVALLDVKPRHARRHRKVASSDQSPSLGRRHSASSLSPSPRGERRSVEDSSEREESSSHSRKDRKKRSHKSSSKGKKSKPSLEIPCEGDNPDSPSVQRKSFSLTHVPSPRESSSAAPAEVKAQRRTRGRKTSSSSAMEDSSEEQEASLIHAVSTPAVMSITAHHTSSDTSETTERGFVTAVNPKKHERARNARAVLRNTEMMPTPPVSRHTAVGRRTTDNSSSDTGGAELDRASLSTLEAPTVEVTATESETSTAVESSAEDRSEGDSRSSCMSAASEASLPTPAALDDSDSEGSSGSFVASPIVSQKKTHRRVRSIGARVSPSISRSSGGHKRRRSGSSMSSSDPEAPKPPPLADAGGNESVRDLVEVFMSAQQALLSSPLDRRSSATQAAPPCKSSITTADNAEESREALAPDTAAAEDPSPVAATTAATSAAAAAAASKGRWRTKSGIAKRKFSSGSVSASTTCVAVDRELGKSRTGEFGKPIRCTPADFARHDSLQEMSTVTSLLGRFRVLTGEAGDMERARPQRMNSAEPSLASSRLIRTRSNSLESPRATAMVVAAVSSELQQKADVLASEKAAQRRASHTTAFGKAGAPTVATAVVDCEFTPVTAIYGSLAQQGVKDPKVLERLQEARESAGSAPSSSSEDSLSEDGAACPASSSFRKESLSAEDSDSTNF